VSGYVATDSGAYERSMGRWSRRLADPFLDAVALPRGAAVLDAGCGTGALAEAIAARDATARITGVDISADFLATARARVPAATFRTGDIAHLPDADGTFDAALSLLVLQFVPDRAAAVSELARVTRPGGLVAAAMWDFTGGFAFLRAFADSVAAAEPDGEAFRTRHWGDAVGSPGRLAGLLDAAGLRDVAERDIMIRQEFSDFADWWEPWLTGQGIAGAFVAALPPDRLPRVAALARRAYLAGAPDGKRSFVAVARLATGRRAGA
jgi:trans-aconitate methyltransferase